MTQSIFTDETKFHFLLQRYNCFGKRLSKGQRNLSVIFSLQLILYKENTFVLISLLTGSAPKPSLNGVAYLLSNFH